MSYYDFEEHRYWKIYPEHSKNYKNEYTFHFKDEKYLVYSVVTLTDKAKLMFGTSHDDALLIEHYWDSRGVECWSYMVQRTINCCDGPYKRSTDCPIEKIIKEVKIPATEGFAQREILGTKAPLYTSGKKVAKKDWEIPQVIQGWIQLAVVFFAVEIFQPWYVKLIIRLIAGWVFSLHRQAYIDAFTVYIRDEDEELLKAKHRIYYGTK